MRLTDFEKGNHENRPSAEIVSASRSKEAKFFKRFFLLFAIPAFGKGN